MNTSKYFLLFLFMVVLTVSADLLLDNWHYREGDHRRLQKEMNRKFEELDRVYRKLQDNNWQLDTPIGGNEGISMVAFKDDSLRYWSDNSLSYNRFKNDDFNDRHFDSISNAWYVIKPYITDSIRAYGLILIKTHYPYENDFLHNGFQPDLHLPASTQLLIQPEPRSYSIVDWEGIYLFSVRFSMNELRFATVEHYLIPILILLTLFCLLMLLHHFIEGFHRSRIKNMLILLLPVFFAAIRWIQYRYHLPADLYDLELFSPIPFGQSDFLPSLGEMFINTILILFVVVEFYLTYRISEKIHLGRYLRGVITISLMILFLSGFFIFSHYIISNLILNSTISFEFYKAAGLSIYTLIGLIIMAIYFACILFLANKLLMLCKARCRFKRLILIFLVAGSVMFLAVYLLTGYIPDAGSCLAFVIIFVSLAVMQYRHIPLGNYTAMTFMVILFSAYSVYIIIHFDGRKTMNNMAVLGENLSAQHDGVAEYLLGDINNRLEKDATLTRYLFNSNTTDEQIHNYLLSNYFNGFWGKYSLLYTPCEPMTDLYGTDTLNCYEYFGRIISEGKSMRLSRTNFYFLDSQNGRINYVGWFKYFNPDSTREISLFLELESRLVTETLGFPELLIDKRYQENTIFSEYSYAKYYKNQLLATSGTFHYSLDLNIYKNRPEEFGGYKHYISDLSKDNVVIVSKPTPSFFNQVVSFSYIFIVYYFLVLLFILLRDFSKLGKEIQFNFKNKIQLSITALIFLSLFLVGGGTIYFSIEQYQRKQHDILGEKIQSVYVELDHLLAYFPQRIPPDWKDENYGDLNQLLIKFSDVFYSDINLYDPEGNLLATSRPQIYEQGLMGEKMNPVAYSRMVKGKQAEFIHRENIGRQDYLSAYIPFVSAHNNKLLAFINLPYFTRQNVLRNEITTLVVAIVNVYVLLILVTIGMAAFISDQITRPLRMIQKRFSQIKLGRKNEEIIYNGQDEIAGLVDEYNRMVRELARSVEMLARSERESAWREMAKQVAHEIKNPLTPMKLSVQHLQRSWNDSRENFDEYLQKVTRTLIEQIDNLSFIASEFSNFAKMPKAISEEINIVDSIRSTLTLFTNTENVDFVFEHESGDIPVYADKEQLSRVFINLIKNAIQSIPDNRNGKIGITLVQNRNMVRISITDNGKGIPDELQNKLFTPSFTTKSSGMGLGLSIVKSIIESFGGNITFNTKVNHGTTFTIELPVYRPSVQG
ncbi:MAG TPA: ATP-binding protein [Bacteroidales bacterium]|nr:ATP-binding protein [Bacteroidales bacterium]